MYPTTNDLVRAQLTEARNVLEAFLQNPENIAAIEKAIHLMAHALKQGRKLISCGNGGSMCDAMHFAEELSGRFRNNRSALAALSISDPSHLSCVANDYGYQFVFSRYLEALGQSGDVLLAISTSGNSANVIEAAKVAKQRGLNVVALTGKDGGALSRLADVEIRAPHSSYADRVQEIHIKVIHCLILGIEQLMFPEN
jgi:D-sedoheptulose 7-phosphate isomerase